MEIPAEPARKTEKPIEQEAETAETSLKSIKVYDLDAFVQKEQEMEAFRYNQVAVFEGKKGIVVAESEAVHQLAKNLSDTVDIPVNKLPEPGKIWLIANYLCTISIDEIIKAPCQERLFTEFFNRRDYNPRCQSNFRTLLHSLCSIDFDLSDYYLQTEPLSQKLHAASTRASSGKQSKPSASKHTERDSR